MKNEQTYSFQLIPEKELYYNDNNNYGVYYFITSDNIPYLQESFDISNKSNNMGIIAGNLQQLIIGEEYQVKATVELNRKYNSWQYKPIKVISKKPTTQDSQLRFLKSIITELQANTLISAYPNIVDDIISNKEIDLSKTKNIKERTLKND